LFYTFIVSHGIYGIVCVCIFHHICLTLMDSCKHLCICIGVNGNILSTVCNSNIKTSVESVVVPDLPGEPVVCFQVLVTCREGVGDE
jgi:hypothetical protein